MSSFSANRFVFIFSIIVGGAAVIYFGYMAFGELGLRVELATPTVLQKQQVAAADTRSVVDECPLMRGRMQFVDGSRYS